MRGKGTGIVASVVVVTLVSLAVAGLHPYVPILSLGVLYVFAVLPVAVAWGTGFAIAVSVASMLAFNWFFLPPTHTFQLRDGANWLALAVYLVTAGVVSALASRGRRRRDDAEQRRREADVLAQAAGDLLRGVEIETELDLLSELTGRALGVAAARIELGDRKGEGAVPLVVGRRVVATVLLGGNDEIDPAVRSRFLPALAAVLGVAVDRAELEAEALEAETLRRSDALKTALLRSVSHDLRSPLTAILASAGALSNPELRLDEADREGLVDAIREEARRLDRLVGNLLDLSRLEAGAVERHPELWSVDELVGQAIDAVAVGGGGGGRVVVDLDPELPPVRVDAGQIERVLANLIENALKYSPPGSRVVVRAEHGATELSIHVLDAGAGLEEAEREAIFQPFRHGDRGGAGLGLAIARGFAEANGGRVWAQVEGAGGHFVLALAAASRPAVTA